MSLRRLTQKMNRYWMQRQGAQCPACGGDVDLGAVVGVEVTRCEGCGRLASLQEMNVWAGRERGLVVVEWENREGLPEFGKELAARMGVGE